MLTAQTKRNIDAARDVLVGKVPDPKTQVEQITTALIYKFMDDLDREAVELGGQVKFFSGEYERYAWSRLLDTRLSGEGRLDLYVQAIKSMERNPNLPQLFRDIFKGAFLPYNDPQTLSLFLKEINQFSYDHSEELGNAFEYLLSVLGSQGDAGQFRTPRHIIDFMVAAVDPQKHETILDPACGTAGFLISAYKHIRKCNSSNYQREANGGTAAVGESAPGLILADKAVYSGDQLTLAERQRLAENIQGYDISPDMVRLSLVNLYLHGFASPRIYEYDTLTSEERWDETFDVILANPPFMTPKGGIRPHRRFQVQAKRSEVLFVDYILEHLNLNGRAAVIVPEGVIFKSDKAYKTLRRLLLDDGLLAVVSLPPGVFNPYSGVKTSILFFNNAVARRVRELLFLKVENDGFDLGAQRRAIAANDLPEALGVLRAWMGGEKQESPLALWVDKARLAADGDYNLTGERYRETVVSHQQKWHQVALRELVEVKNGLWEGKKEPFVDVIVIRNTNFTNSGKIDTSNIAHLQVEKRHFEDRDLQKGDIIVENSGGGPTQPVGRVAFFDINDNNKYSFSNFTSRLRVNNKGIIPEFLFYILRNLYQKGATEKLQNRTSGIRNLNKKAYQELKIPLPPLEVQRDIVAQIQVKQDAIDAARAVIASLEKERRFFGRELANMEGVQWVPLGEVCEKILSGGTPSTKIKEYWEGDIPWITSADIVDLLTAKPRRFITQEAINNSATNLIPKGNVIVVTRVGLGKLFRNDFDVCISQDAQGLIINRKKVLPEFLVFILQEKVEQFKNASQGSTIQGVTKKQLESLLIPLPALSIQKKFLFEAEKIEVIINKNRELIKLLESKIDQVIGGVNGELSVNCNTNW